MEIESRTKTWREAAERGPIERFGRGRALLECGDIRPLCGKSSEGGRCASFEGHAGDCTIVDVEDFDQIAGRRSRDRAERNGK